ncbi:unnamed protein product [Cochlearia groenlandica]
MLKEEKDYLELRHSLEVMLSFVDGKLIVLEDIRIGPDFDIKCHIYTLEEEKKEIKKDMKENPVISYNWAPFEIDFLY